MQNKTPTYHNNIESILAKYAPAPLCIINPQGKISNASEKIDEVFIYDGIQDADLFALTGIKYTDLIKAAQDNNPLTLSRNCRHFRILTSPIGQGDQPSIAMYFFDITAQEKIKTLYNNEKICIAIVNVDNFDELTSTAREENQTLIASQIDKAIRAWGTKMQASLTRYREHQYILTMEKQEFQKLIETKFPILDEAREIETDADFPVTLSIGIGIQGKTPAETEQYAIDALDLALGRGGDQVIVKTCTKIDYYGGKSPTPEKRNKGKSRLIAHGLKQLILQSSKVIIMGHKNPDMDSFGAAVGIYRLTSDMDKEPHILIDQYNDALAALYQAAKETQDYSFINPDKALSIIDPETLIIVVDTHKPDMVECPKLLEKNLKTVVIDHHRKVEESIASPILAYMEPYASSTSELVTEIIQYAGEKKTLTKIEAEALLAGITVDTNQFSVKTGVRTFEAASWLRRSGADTASVKRYFQQSLDTFRIRTGSIAQAEFLPGNIAMSICQGQNPNAQILNAVVADELLTVKDIRASFVAGQDQTGQTIVSARSLGEINVQLVMEQLGGGGHLNTAGAQVTMTPTETIQHLKEILPEFL